MTQGVVFAFLVCCAFASYAAGQKSELDQCTDYQQAIPAYYTCIIKCHQFVLGFSDSAADYCTSKFQLKKAVKNNYNNGDVVNTLKCIAIKCKQFVPNDVCEDSSPIQIGSSTEFSDFSTAISTTSSEDGTISETSTSTPLSSETTIKDSTSSSAPTSISESTTTRSSSTNVETTSPSVSPDNSMISTTPSPLTDSTPRSSQSNDEKLSSDSEECDENENDKNDGGTRDDGINNGGIEDGGSDDRINDGSFSGVTTTTASYSAAKVTTFSSPDSNPYFEDEDCDDDDSLSDDNSPTNDGSAENGGDDSFTGSASDGSGGDGSANPVSDGSGEDDSSSSVDRDFDDSTTNQIPQSSIQQSQNISQPFVVTASTDSPDGYSFESPDGISNDQIPDKKFDTGNRYRNYASSEAGAAQDGSRSYAFSNSGVGKNNPRFPLNPNWIPFGSDSQQAPVYNPQQGLVSNPQQGLVSNPQQRPVYSQPPRPPFNIQQRPVYGPVQRQVYDPQQRQLFGPQQKFAYNPPARPLYNNQQGLVNNSPRGEEYNRLQNPNFVNNGNFSKQNQLQPIPARNYFNRRPIYNQGNEGNLNINNNRIQEDAGRAPPANNARIRRIFPNFVNN